MKTIVVALLVAIAQASFGQAWSFKDMAFMKNVGVATSYNIFTDSTFKEILANASGSSATTWVASVGNNTSTHASVTYSATGLNGQPTFQFSGSGSYFTVTLPATISQPCTIWIVANSESAPLANTEYVVDGTTSGNRLAVMNYGIGGYPWAMNAGTQLTSSTDADSNWHIIEAQFNGGSSVLKIDGSTVVSGAAGSGSDSSATIGNYYGQFYGYGGYVAFVGFQSGLPSNDALPGNYLATLYGLTW